MSRALVNCIPENYFVHIIPSIYGSVSATPNSGCGYTLVELNNTPIEGSVFRGYDITGATLFDDNKFKIQKSDVYVQGIFSHFEYNTLWETDTPFKNMYSITLSDSIDNYDEYIVYGSGNRDNEFWIDTQNRYVVNHTGVNQGGAYYAGRWNTGSTNILINGTDMWLSGTSGYITSSYYMGQNNNATTFCNGTYNTARNTDIHPYKIVGIKEI